MKCKEFGAHFVIQNDQDQDLKRNEWRPRMLPQ